MRVGIPEKLAFTLCLAVSAVTLPWEASAILIVALLLGRMLAPPLRPMNSQASRRFWKVFPLLVLLVSFMTAINGALMRSGGLVFDLGPIGFYDAGLQFGLVTGSRLLLIATTFLILFGSTRIADFAEYLNRIGLPSPIATTVLLALHFLDHLPERIQQIFIAQESRGAPVRGSFVARIRCFFMLLSPLVLSSIVESIERGTALELRGFHSGVSLRRAGPEQGTRSWSAITVAFLALSVLVALYGVWSWLMISR